MRDEWVILHGGALGDLVLTLHLAFSIADLRDCPHVYVISRIDLRPLTGRSVPLEWRSPDALRTHWLFRDDDAPPPAALAELVRGRRVLSCLGDVESPVHERLARLAARGVLSLDPRPTPGDSRHITEQWRERLAASNGTVRFVAPPVPLLSSPGHGANGGRTKIDGAAPYVLVHPGGGGVSKQWPLDGFIAIGAALAAREHGVGFALGPVELERFPDWRARLSQVAPVAECATLGSLSRRLAAATRYIGNDSGPGHVAAALGVPTLTLFGATQASVWRPLGPASRFLQGNPAVADWGIGVPAVLRELEAFDGEFNASRRAGQPVTHRGADGLSLNVEESGR